MAEILAILQAGQYLNPSCMDHLVLVGDPLALGGIYLVKYFQYFSYFISGTITILRNSLA